jgi:hypothetical protein
MSCAIFVIPPNKIYVGNTIKVSVKNENALACSVCSSLDATTWVPVKGMAAKMSELFTSVGISMAQEMLQPYNMICQNCSDLYIQMTINPKLHGSLEMDLKSSNQQLKASATAVSLGLEKMNKDGYFFLKTTADTYTRLYTDQQNMSCSKKALRDYRMYAQRRLKEKDVPHIYNANKNIGSMFYDPFKFSKEAAQHVYDLIFDNEQKEKIIQDLKRNTFKTKEIAGLLQKHAKSLPSPGKMDLRPCP